MNREIKFRNAHIDLETGNFRGFSYWGRIDHRYQPNEDVFTSPTTANATKRMPDQQFTGLKDSKGVEIYEGDLILDKAGRYWKIEYSKDEMGFIFCYLKNEADYKLYSNFNAVYHLPFEIVGNIYETKKQITTP